MQNICISQKKVVPLQSQRFEYEDCIHDIIAQRGV